MNSKHLSPTTKKSMRVTGNKRRRGQQGQTPRFLLRQSRGSQLRAFKKARQMFRSDPSNALTTTEATVTGTAAKNSAPPGTQSARERLREEFRKSTPDTVLDQHLPDPIADHMARISSRLSQRLFQEEQETSPVHNNPLADHRLHQAAQEQSPDRDRDDDDDDDDDAEDGSEPEEDVLEAIGQDLLQPRASEAPFAHLPTDQRSLAHELGAVRSDTSTAATTATVNTPQIDGKNWSRNPGRCEPATSAKFLQPSPWIQVCMDLDELEANASRDEAATATPTANAHTRRIVVPPRLVETLMQGASTDPRGPLSTFSGAARNSDLTPPPLDQVVCRIQNWVVRLDMTLSRTSARRAIDQARIDMLHRSSLRDWVVRRPNPPGTATQGEDDDGTGDAISASLMRKCPKNAHVGEHVGGHVREKSAISASLMRKCHRGAPHTNFSKKLFDDDGDAISASLMRKCPKSAHVPPHVPPHVRKKSDISASVMRKSLSLKNSVPARSDYDRWHVDRMQERWGPIANSDRPQPLAAMIRAVSGHDNCETDVGPEDNRAHHADRPGVPVWDRQIPRVADLVRVIEADRKHLSRQAALRNQARVESVPSVQPQQEDHQLRRPPTDWCDGADLSRRPALNLYNLVYRMLPLGARYDINNFAALKQSTINPKAACLVYSSSRAQEGSNASARVVCTGAKTPAEVAWTLRQLESSLHLAGTLPLTVDRETFDVSNVVASALLPYYVNLDKLQQICRMYCSYNKSRFPGATLRLPELGRMAILVYTTKLIIAGPKNKTMLEKALVYAVHVTWAARYVDMETDAARKMLRSNERVLEELMHDAEIMARNPHLSPWGFAIHQASHTNANKKKHKASAGTARGSKRNSGSSRKRQHVHL